MFKDYTPEQIEAKLKQVNDFEAKFGEKPASKSWRKWCTDVEYRRNEWQFRQNVANNMNPNTDYR